VGGNEDSIKKTDTNTDAVYANTHHMATQEVAKRRYTDAQVTVNPIESTEMDNRENIATLSAFPKLNNIIQRTYCCVTDKKKKKKLLSNSNKGQPRGPGYLYFLRLSRVLHQS